KVVAAKRRSRVRGRWNALNLEGMSKHFGSERIDLPLSADANDTGVPLHEAFAGSRKLFPQVVQKLLHAVGHTEAMLGGRLTEIVFARKPQHRNPNIVVELSNRRRLDERVGDVDGFVG